MRWKRRSGVASSSVGLASPYWTWNTPKVWVGQNHRAWVSDSGGLEIEVLPSIPRAHRLASPQFPRLYSRNKNSSYPVVPWRTSTLLCTDPRTGHCPGSSGHGHCGLLWRWLFSQAFCEALLLQTVSSQLSRFLTPSDVWGHSSGCRFPPCPLPSCHCVFLLELHNEKWIFSYLFPASRAHGQRHYLDISCADIASRRRAFQKIKDHTH